MRFQFHRGIDSREKEVDNSFKNYHLLDMADLIQYLVPTQFLESIFPPITRPKIPAHGKQHLNSRPTPASSRPLPNIIMSIITPLQLAYSNILLTQEIVIYHKLHLRYLQIYSILRNVKCYQSTHHPPLKFMLVLFVILTDEHFSFIFLLSMIFL